MNREAFEAWLEVRGIFFFDEDSAWEGWQARDAEVAALKARVEELEAVCRWYLSTLPQGHPVAGLDDLIERVRKLGVQK